MPNKKKWQNEGEKKRWMAKWVRRKNRPRIILLDDNTINLSNRWKLLRNSFTQSTDTSFHNIRKRRVSLSFSFYLSFLSPFFPSFTFCECFRFFFLQEIILYLIFMWCLYSIHNLKWKYFEMCRLVVRPLCFTFLLIFSSLLDECLIANAKRYTEDKCQRLMRFFDSLSLSLFIIPRKKKRRYILFFILCYIQPNNISHLHIQSLECFADDVVKSSSFNAKKKYNRKKNQFIIAFH